MNIRSRKNTFLYSMKESKCVLTECGCSLTKVMCKKLKFPVLSDKSPVPPDKVPVRSDNSRYLLTRLLFILTAFPLRPEQMPLLSD